MKTTYIFGLIIILFGMCIIISSRFDHPVNNGFFFEELKKGELHPPFQDYFDLPVGTIKVAHRNLNQGVIHISLKTWSHGCPDINFYVMNKTEYVKWASGRTASMVINERLDWFIFDLEIPCKSDWYFVFDNSQDKFTHKHVYCKITLNWTETLDNYLLLIAVNNRILLVGIILLIIGVGITLFTRIK